MFGSYLTVTYYGAILPRRRPHHVLILSVCLSVPCLHLEGKRKGLRIPNLVGRVPGTRTPRGSISRSNGQRSRSRRLIAQFSKNPHNFTASWPINFPFGRCHKDPSPPCPGWPRCHGNGRSVHLSVCLSVPCLRLEGKRNGLGRLNLVRRVPGTRAPRGPVSRSRCQRSRSRRLIALLAKNPHNFTVVRSTSYLAGVIRTPCCLAPGDLVTMATAVSFVWKPRKPQNSTHVQQHARTQLQGWPHSGRTLFLNC